MTNQCIKCGGELPPPKATGRPAKYCGATCRKLATREIRRIDNILEKLQQRLINARLSDAPRKQVAIDEFTAEIAFQEKRLGELLGGMDD